MDETPTLKSPSSPKADGEIPNDLLRKQITEPPKISERIPAEKSKPPEILPNLHKQLTEKPVKETDLIDIKSDKVLTKDTSSNPAVKEKPAAAATQEQKLLPVISESPSKDKSLESIPKKEAAELAFSEEAKLRESSKVSTEKKRQAPKVPTIEVTPEKLESSGNIEKEKSPMTSRNIRKIDDRRRQPKTGWL